jgi:MFS family permease
MAARPTADTPEEDQLRALSDEAYAHVMNAQGTTSGRRTGWVMISTILIEAWDLYSISFLLVFVKAEFQPSALMLGLASASVQLGALLGTLSGGWLADRFGRRPVFLGTMMAFVVLALAQGFVTSMWQLIVLRFLLGFPLGSDIASGYAYIMETMPRRQREVMGSRWQGMFGLGEIAAIVVITVLYLSGMDHGLLWRVALALGALPALVLLISRLHVPETVGSLIQRGRFAQAKTVARTMFGDELTMLPDQDYRLRRPSTRDFLADIWSDRVRRRASIFAWISNACQGAEFATFGYYLPIILVLTGVSGIGATNFLTGGIYIIATVSGFIAPLMLARIGHRGVASWGFGIVFVSLLAAALFLQLRWLWLVPIAAAVLMWGHYWAASNGMTIASMVAPTRYKGTASGFGYMYVKLPLFITLFVFPSMFEALGVPAATMLAAVIPLVGWLAARFVLPEVYGHVEASPVRPN